jgi:hypothetical protein
MIGSESFAMKSSILWRMPHEETPGFIRVTHDWTADERWSQVLGLLGRFGARTRVPPGLYALGTPSDDSPVIATASYRLTFDALRRDLAELSCWILVLDTRGLDVGSAAAAGRFGTDELAGGILSSRLAQIVRHRRIFLPLRAAEAVDVDGVARATGFHALIGPELARDFPRQLRSRDVPSVPAGRPGLAMSEVLAAAPAQIGRSLKGWTGFAFAGLVYAGLGPGGVNLQRALSGGWPLLLLGLAGVLCGSFFGPILYAAFPFVPLWVGGGCAGIAAAAILLQGAGLAAAMDPFLAAGFWLLLPGAGAFLAGRFVQAMPAEPARRAAASARLPVAIAVAVAALSAGALALSKVAQWGRIP